MCSLDLTSVQIDHIIKTWKIPTENSFDSGEDFLFKFFEKHQHYQTFFKKFKYTALEELKGKAGFRDHASKIMNRLSSTIDCLETDDGVEQIGHIWNEIGQSHNTRSIPKQAFMDLKLVILDALTEMCQLSEEQRLAWETLLLYILQFVLGNLDNE